MEFSKKHLSVVKSIQQELKLLYPDVEFSVKPSYFKHNGSTVVNVHWLKGPSLFDVSRHLTDYQNLAIVADRLEATNINGCSPYPTVDFVLCSRSGT